MRYLFKLLINKFLFFALALMLIGCNGCSRYDLKHSVTQDRTKPVSDYLVEDTIASIKKPIDNTFIEENKNLSLQQLFKKYKSAVFMIYTTDGEEGRQGSGFFISPSGLAVSNYHVFEGTNKGSETIKLESGETFKISEVLAFSKENDFIIFKVALTNSNSFFKIAPFASEIGDQVFAIGNPKGLEHTLSTGIVSGYRGDNGKLIQTTAEITHGSSGGPLLNMAGEVIGITTSGLGEANLNFAISISNEQIRGLIN